MFQTLNQQLLMMVQTVLMLLWFLMTMEMPLLLMVHLNTTLPMESLWETALTMMFLLSIAQMQMEMTLMEEMMKMVLP